MPFSASIRLAQSSVSLSGITSARDLPCQVSRRSHIYRQSSGIDARPPDSHDFCPFYKKISEDAAAAEEIIRRLISRLGETSSIYPSIKSRYVELLAKHVPEYASLASMARAHADALTDEGGLTGMIAFRTLIEGLAHVFENVMGYDVSDAAKSRGAKYGYQGLFFEFVQAVLPLVRELAPDMPCPESRLAEDTFVFKVVTSLRRIGGRRQERRKRPRKVARDKAFRARR